MPFVLNNALWVIPVVVLLLLVFPAIRVLREYERAVVFQLGRFWKVKGPGLILVIPVIQQAVRVDLQIRVTDVPTQDIISRDNVLVKVNAVVYYRVIDPRNAIIQVEDFNLATSQLAQTTLRSVLGQHELDEMLAERERLNADLQRILDEQTESWGIKVSNVELKHVDIDESMIRVIARQAEAERVRRAKIIEAEGEQQAAQKILEAATILATRPEAMQLRYLGALMTIANERQLDHRVPGPDRPRAAARRCPPTRRRQRVMRARGEPLAHRHRRAVASSPAILIPCLISARTQHMAILWGGAGLSGWRRRTHLRDGGFPVRHSRRCAPCAGFRWSATGGAASIDSGSGACVEGGAPAEGWPSG